MPLHSVQNFVKDQLNNLAITGGTSINNIQAWVTPPVVTDMAVAPQAYVWGGLLHESRKTMAGNRSTTINTTGAFRELKWGIDIYLKYATLPDDGLVYENFPLVVDSVMEKLRGVTMPQQITDSAHASWKSWIVEIGEEFTVNYGDIHSLQDQRFWLFEAHITANVTEHLQQ